MTDAAPAPEPIDPELTALDREAILARFLARFATEGRSAAFGAAFAELAAWLDVGEDSGVPIDPYAAEDPAEFFAVASEAFFTGSAPFAGTWPELHDLLVRYYACNPPLRA